MGELELKEGEVICENCKGTGQIYQHPSWTCNKCNGTGKLDWVENIVGKKKESTVTGNLTSTCLSYVTMQSVYSNMSSSTMGLSMYSNLSNSKSNIPNIQPPIGTFQRGSVCKKNITKKSFYQKAKNIVNTVMEPVVIKIMTTVLNALVRVSLIGSKK